MKKSTKKETKIKGIYLASFKAIHPGYNLIYQDINGKRDLSGDMMDVELVQYDFIIATPPCNYYSKANYRRDYSAYSLKTKHLLPQIIDKLIKNGKPFIVENVRNKPLFKKIGLYDKECFIYEIGRHTYWTNILLPYISQKEKSNIQYLTKNQRQGTKEVHEVIELFLYCIS